MFFIAYAFIIIRPSLKLIITITMIRDMGYRFIIFLTQFTSFTAVGFGEMSLNSSISMLETYRGFMLGEGQSKLKDGLSKSPVYIISFLPD